LTVLATWGVLTGFAVLGALIGQMDDLGKGDYGLGHAALYLALQTPRRAYESFPMAAVIGTVLALGAHAAKSELVALRAAGLSPMRIGATALMAVALVVVPLMAAMEIVFAFDPQGRLAWIQEAGEADYDETRGWQLRDVKRTTFSARSVAVEQFDVQSWATALRPGAIEASLQHPDLLSTMALGGRIEQLKRNGLDAGVLLEAYWARWFFPLTTLALVFAALPVAFGQQRSGGFGQRLFIGIVFALVARLVQPMLVNLAKAYQWPVVLAYALPVLLLVALGAWWIRRR
jgi:lipopolysaccharide export system permease protein